MDYKTKLCGVLDLDPAKATDQDIEAAAAEVDSLASEADTVTNRLAEFDTLRRDNEALRGQLADADLAPVQHLFKQEELSALRAGLIANRAGTLPLLAIALKPAEPRRSGPIVNRESLKTPTTAVTAGETPVAIMNRIRSRDHCTVEEAIATACREYPAVFNPNLKTQ